MGQPHEGALRHRIVDARGLRGLRNTLHPDDLARAEADSPKTLATAAHTTRNPHRLPEGEVRHIRAVGSTYAGTNGNRKIVGVNWDVTADVKTRATLSEAKRLAEAHSAELEAARHRMEFNALHDPLTGLPNRRFLDQILFDRSRRADANAKISIFHIDLDRFKQINDTMGHAAGDEILKHAASLLRDNARQDDFVARIGGDEFVIIRASGGGDEDAALASRVIEAMSVHGALRRSGMPHRRDIRIALNRCDG